IYFFFQAEDGIRDRTVTGVQTCALPISSGSPDVRPCSRAGFAGKELAEAAAGKSLPQLCDGICTDRRARNGAIVRAGRCEPSPEIGRASCRERVWIMCGWVRVEDITRCR